MTNQEPSTVDILALSTRAAIREGEIRVAAATVGLFLSGLAVLCGSGRRAVTAGLFGTAGGLLLTRSVTGLSPRQIVTTVQKWFGSRPDLEKRFHDGTHDIVDAASFDSFPASDPPSHSPGAN